MKVVAINYLAYRHLMLPKPIVGYLANQGKGRQSTLMARRPLR
jgi:hypothetical protein